MNMKVIFFLLDILPKLGHFFNEGQLPARCQTRPTPSGARMCAWVSRRIRIPLADSLKKVFCLAVSRRM